MNCRPAGSSVHGILPARILEWAAMPSSRGSSRPRDGTQASHTAGLLYCEPLGKLRLKWQSQYPNPHLSNPKVLHCILAKVTKSASRAAICLWMLCWGAISGGVPRKLVWGGWAGGWRPGKRERLVSGFLPLLWLHAHFLEASLIATPSPNRAAHSPHRTSLLCSYGSCCTCYNVLTCSLLTLLTGVWKAGTRSRPTQVLSTAAGVRGTRQVELPLLPVSLTSITVHSQATASEPRSHLWLFSTLDPLPTQNCPSKQIKHHCPTQEDRRPPRPAEYSPTELSHGSPYPIPRRPHSCELFAMSPQPPLTLGHAPQPKTPRAPFLPHSTVRSVFPQQSISNSNSFSKADQTLFPL